MGPLATKLRRLCFALAACVTLAFTAAACSGSDTAAPEPQVGPTATPSSPERVTPDATIPTSIPVIEAPTTPSPPTPTPTPKPAPRSDIEDGFDTHTLSQLTERDDYFGLSADGLNGQQVTKFTIIDFFRDANVVYYDSNFYRLHDEWYWFRLLNGREVPGAPEQPIRTLQFDTVEQVYDWARVQPGLPLGLEFFRDDRLGSTDFYSMAGVDDRPDRMLALGFVGRHFGLGNIVYLPPTDERDEQWLMELEFKDAGGPEIIAQFFDRLIATTPPEIGDNLKWVVRSPAQEDTAAKMVSENLRFADRIVRYSDFISEGTVEVYNPGISAGRVTRIGEGDDGIEFSEADELSILITEFVPDYLPAATALITQNPQTPLAHVNILATNRGIPNASQAGLLEDVGLNSMARVRAPAIVVAEEPDSLRVLPMTEAEFITWFNLRSNTPISVPQAAADIPLVMELEPLAADITRQFEVDELRPSIGGKAAGFLGLLAPGSVITPENPSVITVRGYREHLVQVQGALDAMLTNPEFIDDTLARFLLLEGPEDFADVYTRPSETAFAESFIAAHPPGTLIGDILAADGFKKYFRDQPMATATLAEITAFIDSTFDDHAITQGLRFRSSSSVEDIEGFNGAGLYDSNTGFRDPSLQPKDSDQKKSLEWAIKKTWASYWSFEAFEERQLENVDHQSGAMAVLVHARFDDPQEISNGVFTFTILPNNHSSGSDFEMKLNVQAGAESVTNPTPGLNALPEVDTVREGPNGIEIVRSQASTLVPEGEVILDDAKLNEIFDSAKTVAQSWLDLANTDPLPPQRSSTLVLDFEFREMAAGWPAVPAGEEPFGERIVLKQARTLDPGTRGIDQIIRSLPIPDDVEARATRVEESVCSSPDFNVTTVEVFTNPLSTPDMGWTDESFLASFDMNFTAAVGSRLGIDSGVNLFVDWSNFSIEPDDDPNSVEVVPALSTPIGTLERLRFDTSRAGSYALLDLNGNVVTQSGLACTRTPLLVTAENYLYELVAATDAGTR